MSARRKPPGSTRRVNGRELAASDCSAIATQIAEILMDEQRERQGEFADEERLKAGAAARLRYLVGEGFLDSPNEKLNDSGPATGGN